MQRYTGRTRRRRLPPPVHMMGTGKQIAWAREIYRRLLADAVRVRENCDILALLTDKMDGHALAEWYLTHTARRQRRAVWWINHRNDLAAPWFISAYMERYLGEDLYRPGLNSLIAAVREEALLCPEEPLFPGAVELIMEPDPDKSETGACILKYEKNEAFGNLVRGLDMEWDKTFGGYVRRIEGPFVPLTERCAEIGSRLILSGFRVLALDEEVRIRITTGNFGWEHEKWILPGSTPTRLRMYFPEDRTLFKRAQSMGAFWNGRHVEVAVWREEEIRDFASLYGFRISSGAERCISEWKRREEEGRVVRPHRPRNEEECRDPVREILLGDVQVPEDLIDED